MEWINIVDELPKVGQEVLAYRPYANKHGDEVFTVLVYEGGLRKDFDGRLHGFERCHYVSHWQHLVKPE